jgi:hypothetical protein
MVSTDYLVIECVGKGQIMLGRSLLKLLGVGVKTERIRADNSETVFVTIFISDLESERVVCGYEYEIGVYR